MKSAMICFLILLLPSKAFDMVNRKSLIHRLKCLGFPSSFVYWIEACISDVHFSLVFNGIIKGFFSSSNGLWLGCPLSHFLFTVVMDSFSFLMDCDVDLHQYTPLSIGPCKVSHLLFTDAMLVVGKANFSSVSSLKSILADLESYMGLCINKDKSNLCGNHLQTFTRLIHDELGLISGNFPLNYFGLPLMAGALKFINFN